LPNPFKIGMFGFYLAHVEILERRLTFIADLLNGNL